MDVHSLNTAIAAAMREVLPRTKRSWRAVISTKTRTR